MEIQPEPFTYVMIAVPADVPATIPPVDVIVATVVLLLLQFPPPIALLNVVVVAWHNDVIPVIGATGLTVTVAVARQPPPIV